MVHNSVESSPVRVLNVNQIEVETIELISLVESSDAAIQLNRLSTGVKIQE